MVNFGTQSKGTGLYKKSTKKQHTIYNVDKSQTLYGRLWIPAIIIVYIQLQITEGTEATFCKFLVTNLN